MKICYYKLDSVDSTNDWAKRHLSSFDADTLTVISADEQTAGHGRWGRPWVSPAKKNACLTLVLASDAKPFCLSQLTVIVLQKLLKWACIDAEIKWPNDLLVDDRKISGILLERFDAFTVIGIGLNINMSAFDIEQVPQKATSMAVLCNKEFEVQKVIEHLVELFVKEYEAAVINGFQEVKKSWHEKVQWMLFRKVTVQTTSGPVAGHVKALSADGSVLVETQSGQIIDVQSADTLRL